MGLDVSIGISPRESLADFAEFAAGLERRGVERIWLIDSQLAMKDVYAGLLTAAQRTTDIELATGVTNVLTRHPTVTAGAIAAVAELSGGRAVLGLGSGDSAVRGIGARPSRIAEVEAALRFFGEVLSGEEGEWEGRPFRLPYPTPRVPVHLAVGRPRMCRLAGRLADGAVVMGPAQPDLVAEQLTWIDEGLAEAGRSRSELEVSFVATTSVGDDEAAALDDVRSWASAQARLLADVDQLPEALERHRDELVRAKEGYDYREHLSTRADHQESVSDELARTLAIAGPPEVCAARLQALLDVGVDNLVLPLMGSGRTERMRVIQEEVAPALRL
ncbi:MAG TPA: LLM class flavin-dependent oxidoreductase [Conexibacter sp.]|jgi:5,10-methylenetetrahydromethanopterin reductase